MSRLARLFRRRPAGAVRVVDPSPINWLSITYNTVEELVRVAPGGTTVPAAMKSYTWADDQTLDITLQPDNVFPTGEPLTAHVVARAFAEVFRWEAPHPPGTHFNLDRRTRVEVVGDHRVRLHLPEADGLALGKLRAVHLMSSRFWGEVGFGYTRNGTGEGHW